MFYLLVLINHNISLHELKISYILAVRLLQAYKLVKVKQLLHFVSLKHTGCKNRPRSKQPQCFYIITILLS